MDDHRPARRQGARLYVAALAAALGACVPLGPRTIDWGRTAYNQAVQQTDAQQLLLNIVRQRYNDPVMFLDVTNISSTTTRTATFGLSSFLPSRGAESVTGSIGGTFTETPLIFYAPATGEKFVRQILTPLDLKTLSLLLQSGWSIERVLVIAGDSINGIRNSVAGRGRDGATPYAEYRALVAALRDLQRDGQLTAGLEPGGAAGDTLLLTPAADALGSPAYAAVCRILGLRCDGRPIRVRLGLGAPPPGGDTVTLATRSLYAAFYFLSDAVDVPADDLARGAVQTRALAGGPFDRATGDLLRISHAAAEPAEAAVKVFHRGAWFYIAETDADSKTTFALMSLMLLLQGGDSARMAPLVSVSPG
jgi:hypothetical protein